MQYSSNMTSKGQVTIPVAIRRKLGLKPGQSVRFSVSGESVKLEAQDWRKELEALGARVRAHMAARGLKPLTDDQLRQAREQAWQDAATYRVERMQS